MSNANKKFLWDYTHNGEKWGFELFAESEQDALEKIKSLYQTREFLGECVMTVKVKEKSLLDKFTRWITGGKTK